MRSILACRVFERELQALGKSGLVDYFEPMCHRLRESEFSRYVASLADGHDALLCGDCGGLSQLAASRDMRIPPYEDCIGILLPRMDRDPGTLYLTGGWIEHFDVIFGLDRLPPEAKRSATCALFSSISRVAYVSTQASGGEEGARGLAELLGCDVLSLRGSLSNLARSLEELRE